MGTAFVGVVKNDNVFRIQSHRLSDPACSKCEAALM